MANLTVEETQDPERALAQVAPLLVRQPISNNILLSVLHERVAHPGPGRYWIVRDGDHPVGFGLQSPLRLCAGLSPMRPGAARALARHLATTGIATTGIATTGIATTSAAGPQEVKAQGGKSRGVKPNEPFAPTLPGVIAEASTAAAFAGAWSECVPEPVVPVEGQRIYRLGKLRPPGTPPQGHLRPATAVDRELLVGWRRAFAAVTGNDADGDPTVAVQHDLESGRMFVWDDDGPCACVRAAPLVAGVCRIGIVYVPQERRRRGYAGASVAALCAQVQEHEPVTCMLYTQLANPTSNGLYRRLGFEAVAEVLRFRFGQ